jgi:YjbE family integral membrane protein
MIPVATRARRSLRFTVPESLLDPQFWLRVLQIIGIDILLSGDNALVIALACRSLPPKQQRIGVILGAGAAVALRVIFAVFIVYLLQVPYLKLAGGLLLFWIAVKLVLPEPGDGHDASVSSSTNLWGAVRTVVVADAVMSLDNVVAIAAAAKGSVALLVFGLAVSIPLIVYGSTLILKLIHRFPIVITAGGALLGYIAAEVIITDPVLLPFIEHNWPALHRLGPWMGAVFVVLVGWLFSRRAAPDASAA